VPKTEDACLFGVNLSSVERYTRIIRQLRRFSSPEKGVRTSVLGKIDKEVEKLLEENLEGRSSATISDRHRYLERLTTGKILSDSTVRRLLRRLGFSRKKNCGRDGTRRVAKGSLAGDRRRKGRSLAPGVRERDGRQQHLALPALRFVTQRRTGARQGAT
jgi:transposase